MLPTSRFRVTTAFLALLSLMSMLLLMKSGTLAAGTSFKLLSLSPTASQVTTPTPASCGNWNLISSPNLGAVNNTLSGVTAVSAKNVWAVGNYSTSNNPSQPQPETLIENWNGSNWNIIASPNVGASNNSLTGVAAILTNDVWAVGYYYNTSTPSVQQTLIENWNGTNWNIISSPNPGSSYSTLYGVAALSASNVWAVGHYSDGTTPSNTLVEHWNGTNWMVIASPNVGGPDILNGVAAISAKNVWAVGSYNNRSGMSQTLIEHWNGKIWSVVTSPNVGSGYNFLNGVAAISAKNVWAVGSYTDSNGLSQALIEHWNGISWSIVASPNPGSSFSYLSAVTTISANNVWAVGLSGGIGIDPSLIEHWNGTSWSVVASPNPGSSVNSLNAVARVPGSGLIWAVGYESNTSTQTTLTEFYC